MRRFFSEAKLTGMMIGALLLCLCGCSAVAFGNGKIHSIGLSNLYVDELETFLPQVFITPALVQNEIHPYYQEDDVIPYI